MSRAEEIASAWRRDSYSLETIAELVLQRDADIHRMQQELIRKNREPKRSGCPYCRAYGR